MSGTVSWGGGGLGSASAARARAPARAARAALLAVALGLLPGMAATQARQINPCDFSQTDSPCKIEGGVYRALVPEGIGPHPAVLYLYGSLGRSRAITDTAYFRREVVNRGYALIVPAATDTVYRGGLRGTGWGWSGRQWSIERDDFAFVARVIEDARRRHNIDPGRVVFAGQSDGGFFIWEIACHRPEMGAAFAVHAGAYGNRLPRDCRAPVRLLHTHGTRDDVVPPDGRREGGSFPPVAEAMALMARTNRCARGPEERGRYFGFRRSGWDGCAPGSALDYLEHDGGHSWPPTWMPAVLDWFERTGVRPAVSVTRRVGDGAAGGAGGGGGGGGGLFKRAGDAGGRFKSAPRN